MSGKKISELQELTSLENNDLLVVVDDSEANIENKTKNVKVSTVRSEIDAAVQVEQTARVQQDGVLQSSIDAEISARQDADAALEDRISPIEYRSQFNNIYAYEDNAAVYADGAAPIADPSLLRRDGWYFTNIVAGSKINWYFFDGNPLSATYQGQITLENFSAYAVVTLDSLASSPIIGIYTLPTGSGDVLPGFAHSRLAYSGYVAGSPEIGKKCLIYVGDDPLVHPELPRFKMALSVGSSSGDQDPSEIVLTASFGSNSSASVGSVQFLAESLGVHSPSVKQEMDLRVRTVTSINGQVGDVVINAAEESRSLIADVFNNTGSPIPKMTVVYINGGQGDMPTVALAQANSESSSSKTFAVTAELIGNMLLGKAVVSGALKGLDTTVFGAVEGTTLYLSPTVAGGITATKPVAPNHMVAIGKLVRVHQNQGVIEVSIQNGYEIDELHDVLVSGVTDGQVLKYDQSTSLWKNQTLTAADVGLSTVSSDLNNKANTNLSNLVTTSIPSGVDIISNSGSGVQFDVKTIGSASGNTGIGSFGSGSTTLGGSGYVELISGTGNASSGVAYVETGKASTGTSGGVQILTGRIANDGYAINNGSNGSNTGSIVIQSGLVNSTFSYPVGSVVKSGAISISSGASNSAAGSGNVTMQSGTSSSSTGFSGQALLRSGDATVSGGSTGNTFVLSGSVSDGAGNSGATEVRSGTTVDGTTGNVSVSSGVSSGLGSSGFAQLKSGNTVNGSTGNALVYSGESTGTGNTGIAQLFSGGSVSGSTGNVTVASGNSSSGGATGNVTLQTGSTSGARGEVVVNSPALNMNSNKITRVAEFYFGDPDVDGTYRIRPSGGSLVTERRESGVWVVKQTIS